MEVPRKFSTKLQLLHRIQEGISFGDGDEYNPGSYQRYASNFTKHYKKREYPDHDLLMSASSKNKNNLEEEDGTAQENEESEESGTHWLIYV